MNNDALIQAVTSRCSDAVSAQHAYRGDATLTLRPESLVEVARTLKDDADLAMDLLVDLTAVDYLTYGDKGSPAFFSSSGVSVRPDTQIPDAEPWPGPPAESRYALVCHFYSTSHKHRLRLVVPIADDDEPKVDTLSELWPAANWLEREVWDMYGIDFQGHPDQKRILMYEEFEGHPLRKDYKTNKRQPLIGPAN
jgi:NADH-quinone oxidoreductase subunit C